MGSNRVLGRSFQRGVGQLESRAHGATSCNRPSQIWGQPSPPKAAYIPVGTFGQFEFLDPERVNVVPFRC